MKLWGSRMGKPTDGLAHRLNASFQFDNRMYNEDIDASLAWARALADTGLLEKGELDGLTKGLEEVRSEFEVGAFEPSASDEDIHTAVERRLTIIVGPVAGKLHTGRSRKDQVSTDFRLWIMRACDYLISLLVELQKSLLCLAEADQETALPGFTHLQPAQPVLRAHWVLSHFWPFDRQPGRVARHTQRPALRLR